MTRPRSPILWLVVATVVVVGAWFVVTPRRAWHEFLGALAQNDGSALQAVVDFPALRQHADSDLTIALAQQVKNRAGVPARLRDDLMRQMIDTMTSPSGLLQLVTSFSMESGTGEPVQTKFRYHGISRVDVLLGGTGAVDNGAGLFTFKRTGLRWRLVRASSQRIAALAPGS